MGTATAVGGYLATREADAPANSARALFESPEMAETMRKNYVHFDPSDAQKRDMRDKIQGDLAKITKHIKDTEPKVFDQLNTLELTAEQKNNVLKVVGNMADDRMVKIGKEVAQMAKDSKSEEELKRKLKDTLGKNKTRLVNLRNEILPAPLRKMVDKDWDLSFDVDNMRLFRNSQKHHWNIEVSMDKPTSRRLLDSWGSTGSSGSSGSDISESGHTGGIMDLSDDSMDAMSGKFEQGLGVMAGMLEQVRVALDQIDFVGESFDIDMKIPYWAKSMIGGLDFVSELSDCVMRSENNQVKLMMCPVKYASAATDFLESVDNVFGFNNGHFWGGGSSTPAPGQPMQYQQQPYYPPQQQGYYPQPYGYQPQGAAQTYR